MSNDRSYGGKIMSASYTYTCMHMNIHIDRFHCMSTDKLSLYHGNQIICENPGYTQVYLLATLSAMIATYMHTNIYIDGCDTSHCMSTMLI